MVLQKNQKRRHPNPTLKLELQRIFKKYHHQNFLANDPLCFPHQYKKHKDRERVALLSALFAFGNVKQIQGALRKWLALASENSFSLEDLGKITFESSGKDERLVPFLDFRHRIYVGTDVLAMLALERWSTIEFGSLREHFEAHHCIDSVSVEESLSGVIADWTRVVNERKFPVGKSFSHMLTSPANGGVCKRWVMFLKWMVRDDDIDLGFWAKGTIRKAQLVIPMDVHVSRLVRSFGLLDGKSQTWKNALIATRNLSAYDPEDPTRFDFSMCRLGMFEK